MKLSKAIVAQVQLGNVALEGLMMPNGDYRVGLSQLSELNLIPPNRSLKQLRDLLGYEFRVETVQSELTSKPVNTVDMTELRQIALILYNKKPSALNFNILKGVTQYLGHSTEDIETLHRHNKRKTKRPNSKRAEHEVRDAYHARYGGQTEVTTPLGRIDLLTDSALYEFKYYLKYKEALGQVLCYSRYYNRPNKVIVLFGCPDNYKYTQAHNDFRNLCEGYGITILRLR